MRTLFCLILVLLIASTTSYGQEAPGPEASALLNRAVAMDNDGKVDDAIRLLDEGLDHYTQPDYDRYFILNYKFHILSRQNLHSDAIPVAVEKANIIRSPKQALVVAQTYLTVDDSQRALEWIHRSVDRGLQSYDIFDDPVYESLRGDERFTSLVDTVKRRNGIGLQARSFDRESISGRPVTLAQFRGKVLLVDFWATWCAPCIKQMPHLKKCYEQYRERGFEIIGFSNDTDIAQLKKYLKTNGIMWDNVFCPDSQNDETMLLYGIANIPASFLIDRRGILRHVNLSGERLETAIAELLNE